MTPGNVVLAQRTIRLDALTGLRWWAAFAVFVYHMRIFAPLPSSHLRALINQGFFGVTFFFVLSGFVLTWSMRPGVSKSTFYTRRFARIWPSHMVGLLLAVPVFYTLSTIPAGSFLKPFDLGILLLSVVVLQGWWAAPNVLFSGNPAAWTLTVEALFYALHPWISRLLTPLSRRGALGVAAFALVWAFGYRLGVVLWPTSWLAAVPMPITRVPEFLLGMGLAWAMRSGWVPRLHSLVGIGALAAVLFGIVFAISRPSLAPLLPFNNEFFTLAVGIAIVAIASHTLRGKRSMFEQRWQVKLGEWSFVFYLVHATVIYLALRLFGGQAASWRNLLWMAGIFAIALLLSWALHTYVERPCEKLIRGWKDRRDARRAVQTSATSGGSGAGEPETSLIEKGTK